MRTAPHTSGARVRKPPGRNRGREGAVPRALWGFERDRSTSRVRATRTMATVTVICRREGFQFKGDSWIDGRRLATERQRRCHGVVSRHDVVAGISRRRQCSFRQDRVTANPQRGCRIALASGHCLTLVTQQQPGAAVDVVLRPENLSIAAHPPEDQVNTIAGRNLRIVFPGQQCRI